MTKIYYKNRQNFDKIVKNIQDQWVDKLHILADFDRTLTKNFVDGEKRPSLISVLRKEWYLWEEYSKKAYELFDYYNAIEINPNYPIEEKKEQMFIWWSKHLQLIVDSKLHKNIIDKVANSWIMVLRNWMKNLFKKLDNNNIPVVIISANWLWLDSIKTYLEYENCLYKNINVVWNSFTFWEDWYVTWYKSEIVHVFNKDETVLEQFPEIHNKLEFRKNVILLGDSLWDVWMIEWFNYNNLIKIGFLNDNEEVLLGSYLEKYDLVVTWDSDMQFFNDLNII
jgi:HAD superfamily hydrolase (TIGR01544 family)